MVLAGVKYDGISIKKIHKTDWINGFCTTLSFYFISSYINLKKKTHTTVGSNSVVGQTPT